MKCEATHPQEHILGSLCDVIDLIENYPDINLIGVKVLLEGMLHKQRGLKGGLMLYADERPPEIFLDIVEYYNYIVTYISGNEVHRTPNRVGILKDIKQIRDRHSQKTAY